MLPANRWGCFAPIRLAEYADNFFRTMGFPFHEYSSMAVKKHSHPKWSNYWGSRHLGQGHDALMKLILVGGRRPGMVGIS